jgi:hypothetical protein
MTLNVRPETAALLARELDVLDVEFDIDGAVIHMYPTRGVSSVDEVSVLRLAYMAAVDGSWWHERGRP